MNFSISTDLFRGPADLLLFLVRRHELELSQISLASVTEQYIEYMDILAEIEINAVGDFLEVASLLVEMKSKALLPRTEEDTQQAYVDPRQDLVTRLLLYKKFKDAAVLLEERRLRWQHRYQRIADDLPSKKIDYSTQPILDIELWDLVSAFGRVLRDNLPKPQENIIYDETPIQTYMHRIHRQLASEHKIRFTSLFQKGMHKSAMVGVFLALLELTRHHNVLAQQSDLHAEILIVPGQDFDSTTEFGDVDDYGQSPPSGDPASMVE